MKKKILTTLLAATMSLGLIGCNRQIIDLTYKYDYAIIELYNGKVVEGKVQSWKDYEGEQLQVVIDGVTYLTHAENVIMVAE